MCSLCTRPALSVQGPLQTRRSSSQGDMHNHGRGDGWGVGGGWNGGETCKASYTYGTLYCTPFRYSYGCFGFRFDFLCCYTQRKQPQLCTSKGPPAIPHRQTTAARRAVPCATDRQELLRRGGDDILLIKKTPPFSSSPQITVQWGKKNYTRKTLFATMHSKIVIIIKKKDAAMRYWNCQIKHTVGEVSKQLFFAKKNSKPFFFLWKWLTCCLQINPKLFYILKVWLSFVWGVCLQAVLFFFFFFTWSRPCGKSFFKDLVYTGKAAAVRLQCSQVVWKYKNADADSGDKGLFQTSIQPLL